MMGFFLTFYFKVVVYSKEVTKIVQDGLGGSSPNDLSHGMVPDNLYTVTYHTGWSQITLTHDLSQRMVPDNPYP